MCVEWRVRGVCSDLALRALHEMGEGAGEPGRDRAVYHNVMIALARDGRHEDACGLVVQMRTKGVRPDVVSATAARPS